MNISSRHSNSNVACSWAFIALPILQKLSTYRRWSLYDMSTEVKFQFTPNKRSMNINMVIKI